MCDGCGALLSQKQKQKQTKIKIFLFNSSSHTEPHEVTQPAAFALPSAFGRGGSNLPSKMQKRKHQLSSLVAEAKSKEMELREFHANGAKTRGEVQARFGWK